VRMGEGGRIGSGSYEIAGVGINGVQTSGSTVREREQTDRPIYMETLSNGTLLCVTPPFCHISQSVNLSNGTLLSC
jgi:hypothetical protein